MVTKKMVAAALLSVLVVAATGVSQAQTESAIAVLRSDVQADRQAIVAANLPMTETESAAFWPVYRAYRMEMAAIGDQILAGITTYSKAFNEASLTDEQGVALTRDFLKAQKAAIELKEEYIAKFNGILPGRSVARFLQIENKLDAAVAVWVADEIPLVEVE